MSAVEISASPSNPFDLSIIGRQKKFRLAISEPSNFGQGTPEEAQNLLLTVMVAHLLGPDFPRVIRSNFPIEQTNFLSELYRYYGHKSPKIVRNQDQIALAYPETTTEPRKNVEVASAHSGGLDSVYRLMNCFSKDKEIMAVHLRNLNTKGNSREAIASREQCEILGIPYEQIRIINNSGNFNLDSMRTRDMLLALVIAIHTNPLGVNKVLIEGGMSSDPTNSHFSENLVAWEMFNELIKRAGLNMIVEGVDPGDIETVGEILKLEQKLGLNILPTVQNCFSAPFQLSNNRGKWERKTPFLANKSPEHWCGSCIKCRRMTLGRIYYEDPKLKNLPENERDYFVADTLKWIEKYPHNADILSASFISHLLSLS